MRFKYFMDSHLFGEVKDKLINNKTKFQLEYLHEMDTLSEQFCSCSTLGSLYHCIE